MLRFQCDICHDKVLVRNQNQLVRCLFCGKILCEGCSHYGICASDLPRLTTEDLQKVKQIDARTHPGMAIGPALIILSLLVFAVGGIGIVYGTRLKTFSFSTFITVMIVSMVLACASLPAFAAAQDFKLEKTAEKARLIQKYR